MTRLSRELQLLQAQHAGREIDSVFQSAFDDIEMMSGLISDSLRRSGDSSTLPWEDDIFVRKTSFIMQSYIDNTPYYMQIRFVDKAMDNVLTVSRNQGISRGKSSVAGLEVKGIRETDFSSFHISPIVKSSDASKYFIHLSKPICNAQNHFAGAVIFDLEYTWVMKLVQKIHIGNQGYAFLVDKYGRTIAHPSFLPYEYDLTRYEDPNLREFIIHMLSGKSGWMRFYDQGEKAAAFSPIPSMNWSLAVGIPIDEFRREAERLRWNTLLVVFIMIFLSTVIVIFLSFRVIRPIRNLVMATEQVASGDLNREIPVQSKDELGLLTVSFNRMIRSLREIQNELVASEKLISMGRLSAGVAHEIRNPLNAMKGAVVYLKRRRSDDALVMKYAAIILEEVERLSEFVTEFLLFAKQSEPRKLPTDLNEMLRTTRTLFENEFQGHGIEVMETLDNGLPIVMMDPQQMEQVFLNVFINAGHAMHGGGRLEIISRWESLDAATEEVETEKISGAACILIVDNGTGIVEGDLKYIFDPFYSTKESGTGLGLPISLSIVENHGGNLKISSIKGRGTTVFIKLPVS